MSPYLLAPSTTKSKAPDRERRRGCRARGRGTRFPCAAAFTLPEVVGALMIMSVVMVALGSTIVMASRAIPVGDTHGGHAIRQARVLQQITEDLSSATRFLDRQATRVRFIVDDRDGDGAHDTLDYQWSGTPGEPLTLQFNNATTLEMIGDVQHFNLEYVVEPRRRRACVLVVCDEPDGVSTSDTKRIARLESFGIPVTRIEDAASQSAYDTAVAAHDVAYIPRHIRATELQEKLLACSIGVVSEHRRHAKDFGFASGVCSAVSDDQMTVVSDAHPITNGLSTGNLALSTDSPLARIRGVLAPGAQVLIRTRVGNDPALVVMEKGTRLFGGGTAHGRRVKLPWGTGPRFDFEELTTDSMELTIRAIDWAAGNTVVAAVSIGLRSGGDTTPMMETKASVVNRPTVSGP